MLLTGFFVALAILFAFMALSALAGVVTFVFWLVLLPFKLLGLLLRGVVLLAFLPVLILLGLAVAVLVGIPLLLAFAIPLLPLALLVAGIVWIVRRGSQQPAPTH